MKRRYTFDSTGRLPLRDTYEEAAEDWGDIDLPSVVFWTDYDDRGRRVAEGSTAIIAPYGTIVYWSE